MNLPASHGPASHEKAISDVTNQAAKTLICAFPYEYEKRINDALDSLLSVVPDRQALLVQFSKDSPDYLQITGRSTLCQPTLDRVALTQIQQWLPTLRALECVEIEPGSQMPWDDPDIDLDHEPGYRLLLVPVSCRRYIKGFLALQRRSQDVSWTETVKNELVDFGEVVGAALELRYNEFYLGDLIRENRALLRRTIQVQEEERKRLSQSLHDETGQYLTALKSDAAIVARRLRESESDLVENANAILNTARHVYEVVYDVMGQLSAMSLHELGLQDALHTCVANSRLEAHGVTVNVSTSGGFDDLDDAIGMTIYRVTQEALTNIAKYAQATAVDVKLERSNSQILDRRQGHRVYQQTHDQSPHERLLDIDMLELTIADNGVGMSEVPSNQRGGYGIRGMKERFKALGGRLEVNSEPNQGTTIMGVLQLSTKIVD